MNNDVSLGDWEAEVVKSNDRDLMKYDKHHATRVPSPHEIDNPEEERLQPANNIIKDVIDNLDRDVNNASGMNTIDFNTELEPMEISALTTLQMLSTLGLGGFECGLLAQRIQRNKVSIKRKGRTEKVDIIKGEREHETANKESSLFGKVAGFMKGSGGEK